MNCESQSISGIVFQCDLEGRILDIPHDGLGIADQFPQQALLSSCVERENFAKIMNFLVELRQKRMTFDWQINVKLREDITPLTFAGTLVEDTLVILAAPSREDVMRLYEDLMQINNEQMNALRASMKQQSEMSQAHTRKDSSMFDELTQAYNELANLQREVAKQNAELERLNEQKNRFLGMASHDLRNPLGIIQMYSDFLLDEASDVLNEEHIEFLSIIQRSSQFMLELVNDFLDLSRIESGKLDLDLGSVNIITIVGNTVALNRILAGKKHITLDFFYEKDPLEVTLDAHRIEQVLNNLLSNAIKFSPAESRISVRVMEEAHTVTIAVQDHGPGIPEQELEKMFEPFERTSVKSTAGEKSSGLGLAIAKKIVEAQGGTLRVESEVGNGSTFFVSLPLKSESRDNVQ